MICSVPIPLNRRLYARFPVRLSAKVSARPFPHEIHAEILDISLGGALMKVHLPLDNDIRLSFELGGTRCTFNATIAHQVPGADDQQPTYGVEFHPDPEMEMTLKRLLPPKSR